MKKDNIKQEDRKRYLIQPFGSRLLILAAILLLFVLALFSLSIGRYPVSIGDIFGFFFTGRYSDEDIGIVIMNVRLPRILAAILAGGALSASGAAYQGMFRNPMVSPDILGVSSGAGFGAALAIVLSAGIFAIQAMSFLFGLSAVMLSITVSRAMGKNHGRKLILILSGMVIGSLFSAFISLIKYVADPELKLPAITYWLMGSLSDISLGDLRVVTPLVFAGFIPLYLVAWKINVLSSGEEDAKAMGLNTEKLRILVILCASLMTATMISVTGIIGWVGLIIPHFSRLITGPDHKALLPMSFLTGSIFMLLVDNIARSLSTIEIPLGILTAIIGAPFFLMFLYRSSKRHE